MAITDHVAHADEWVANTSTSASRTLFIRCLLVSLSRRWMILSFPGAWNQSRRRTIVPSSIPPSRSLSTRMRPRPQIPSETEEYRDEGWCREGTRQVETADAAERFIEQVGFAACLTDSRRPGPSLYVSVCGRRDAVMPRNVQKDPEASLTWTLKDELVRRGKVYYAKLARGKATFVAPRMVP